MEAKDGYDREYRVALYFLFLFMIIINFFKTAAFPLLRGQNSPKMAHLESEAESCRTLS